MVGTFKLNCKYKPIKDIKHIFKVHSRYLLGKHEINGKKKKKAWNWQKVSKLTLLME